MMIMKKMRICSMIICIVLVSSSFGSVCLAAKDNYLADMYKDIEVPEDESSGDIDYMEPEQGNTIEAILQYLFCVMGDVLMWALRKLFGNDLSVHAIVFNEFDYTKITLFSQSASTNSGNAASANLNEALAKTVNYWYNRLLTFTYICFIIVLVYIGIKLILNAGTQDQDKAKKNFGNWVLGLLILLIVPNTVLPLGFRFNEVLVSYIGQGTTKITSYQTIYDKYGIRDFTSVLGGDPLSKAVKTLSKMQAEEEQASQEAKKSAQDILDDYYKTTLLNTLNNYGIAMPQDKMEIIKSIFNDGYNYYKGNKGKNAETETLLANILGTAGAGISYEQSKNIAATIYNQVLAKYAEAYEHETNAEEIAEDIKSLKLNIMAQMRSLAGEYHRLIFAFVWMILLFQIISLLMIYFKRIFVIAILIAIFPLIMLFYCIDKMADGKAQTLTLWSNEMIANIFIQTVHAIIYRVLIEMGLEIFLGNEGHWIFLVGAMILLVPAETVMKEIFNLRGITLGGLSKLTDSLMKAAMTIGALRTFATAGKSKKDKAYVEKFEKRQKQLQRSQNRADAKAKTRTLKRTIRHPGTGGAATTRREKMREGIYHATTNIRMGTAKAYPHLANAGRIARNTAAVSAGLLYTASQGGGAEAFAQGAMMAKGISGKTSDVKGNPDLRIGLVSAYKRKKP